MKTPPLKSLLNGTESKLLKTVLIYVKDGLNLGSYANTQADPMEGGNAF